MEEMEAAGNAAIDRQENMDELVQALQMTKLTNEETMEGQSGRFAAEMENEAAAAATLKRQLDVARAKAVRLQEWADEHQQQDANSARSSF